MQWFRCYCCCCQSDSNSDHNHDHGNLGKDQHRCVQNGGSPQQAQAHTTHIHEDHRMNSSSVQTHGHSDPDAHPLILTTTHRSQRWGFPDQPTDRLTNRWKQVGMTLVVVPLDLLNANPYRYDVGRHQFWLGVFSLWFDS